MTYFSASSLMVSLSDELDHVALRAPDDRAGKMQMRGCGRSARQDEARERAQGVVEFVDLLFERFDLFRAHAQPRPRGSVALRHAEIGADVEQVVLHQRQEAPDLGILDVQAARRRSRHWPRRCRRTPSPGCDISASGRRRRATSRRGLRPWCRCDRASWRAFRIRASARNIDAFWGEVEPSLSPTPGSVISGNGDFIRSQTKSTREDP